MQQYKRVETEIAGRAFSIETGRFAAQADGAAMVRYGDTMVLVTSVSDKPREGIDFFPLQVEYREKAYAAGKIPGGFFKREGRPSEKEVLSARITDRSLRPLFPKTYTCEVQVIASVLSADSANPPDTLSVVGASAALALSSIPFGGPVGAVRIGYRDGRVIVNPSLDELTESLLDMTVTGTRDSIIMVEGGAYEVPENVVVEALAQAQGVITRIVELIDELSRDASKPKQKVPEPSENVELSAALRELAHDRLRRTLYGGDKHTRRDTIMAIIDEAKAKFADAFPDGDRPIMDGIHALQAEVMRERILAEGIRVDGRDAETVRPITCELSVLPRAHGSAVFTRGETQAIAAATLGTKYDEQKIDALEGESFKSFMLHYNFPPFSVNEVRPIRGTSRRETGHGALAERALAPVVPAEGHFPYTIRVVSDILMSNGSSSMATVCGGSMALMDAGVPIKSAVAGVAMGMIVGQDKTAILTDILGDEDHLGDMDFKVAGTRDGITAFQMDIKVGGIDSATMARALEQARVARMHILDVMDATIAKARPELSPYAPRISIVKIPVEDIGKVIGPGGKTIRGITERTGAKIDIDDDGTVFIAAADQTSGRMAEDIVRAIVERPQIDKVYEGVVRRIAAFGAFVEILPGTDGLVHISELEWHRVERTEDVCKVGDKMTVKVIGIDPEGKVKLSRKELLPRPDGVAERRPREPRRSSSRSRSE